jgi:hypothetical protein
LASTMALASSLAIFAANNFVCIFGLILCACWDLPATLPAVYFVQFNTSSFCRKSESVLIQLNANMIQWMSAISSVTATTATATAVLPRSRETLSAGLPQFQPVAILHDPISGPGSGTCVCSQHYEQ